MKTKEQILEGIKEVLKTGELTLEQLVYNSWCVIQLYEAKDINLNVYDDLYAVFILNILESKYSEKDRYEDFWYQMLYGISELYSYNEWILNNKENIEWINILDKANKIYDSYFLNPKDWLLNYRIKLKENNVN